ncbi:UNKNOWN [Stylonychia lemnae]|uniref:Uncharacterized protein n=1 Tax=Stylonychia lemnae TaxID=5949 RepID=A0A078AWN4_STYLE|nr:UNKNOWN [Stylonychia lemnae]|eukprot:CDW86446.1 UNKNOWN [Stylonychia lemnae]
MPAFAYPMMKFDDDDKQMSWKTLVNTVVQKPHEKVIPVQQMLNLLKDQYDEYSDVMKAFTFGWKLNRQGKGMSTIKDKIKRIEEARLQKWTVKCLLHHKSTSICGERDKNFMRVRENLYRLPQKFAFFLIDDDNEDIWQCLKRQVSHPNFLHYLPMEEQNKRLKLERQEKSRKGTNGEVLKLIDEEEKLREESKSIADSFALDYQIPEQIKEAEKKALQEIMDQEYEAKIKRDLAIKEMNMNIANYKFNRRKFGRDNQSRNLINQDSEGQIELNDKINQFKDSITQQQMDELRQRKFVQESIKKQKDKLFQQQYQQKNKNNPLFRKIYRYRDWKNIYLDRSNFNTIDGSRNPLQSIERSNIYQQNAEKPSLQSFASPVSASLNQDSFLDQIMNKTSQLSSNQRYQQSFYSNKSSQKKSRQRDSSSQFSSQYQQKNVYKNIENTEFSSRINYSFNQGSLGVSLNAQPKSKRISRRYTSIINSLSRYT